MKALFSLVLVLILSALGFYACSSFKAFEDSAPAQAEKTEISDEGWNGSNSTSVVDVSQDVGAEEAVNAASSSSSEKINF